MRETIVIDARDNVATVLVPLKAGTTQTVDTGDAGLSVALSQDIPYGHKFALEPIAKGGAVRKYGADIGVATADIAAGEHVHIHNITSRRFRGDSEGK